MTCKIHTDHDHKHAPNCGHTALQHEGHIDYVHDGHLHHMHNGHIDDHSLSENSNNHSACTPKHACSGHDKQHKHDSSCGHEMIPHGDHIDYLVAGHLHHSCSSHCDDHGLVSAAGN